MAAVVDVGAALDREIGVLEELQGRLLERALGEHETQHDQQFYSVAGGSRANKAAISIAVSAASSPLWPADAADPGLGLGERVGREHAEDHRDRRCRARPA